MCADVKQPGVRVLLKGYTTGACAAAAAKAAAMLLLGGGAPDVVEIPFPGGERVSFKIASAKVAGGAAEASVIKFAGDDPDVTNGVRITSRVERINNKGIEFAAGEGVGTVTKPGLSIPPGEPAINPVPRRMIEAAVREVAEDGVRVTVSIEGGAALAEKTFNPRLGVAGGLSVLGTTGYVVPYSCPAVRETMRLSLEVALASGVKVPVLVPGNIGAKAARRHFNVAEEQVVEAGNEWGYMAELLSGAKIEGLLVVGHPGKLAKLTAGKWDTHSSRSEMAVPEVLEAAAQALGREVESAGTVEGVFTALAPDDRKRVADEVSARISKAIGDKIGGVIYPSVALVSMDGELLGESGEMSRWRA